MSKVLGIVAEYNPFHNGHMYHLQKAKELSNADYTICVMSGNFVQRGNTSLVNKWTKARMAVMNGIDLIIELPTIYSVSSAENFAQGAIKILENLNIVDSISFGVETEDVAALNNIANVLYEEPKEYKNLLNKELQKGLSYPKARENAMILYLNDSKRYMSVLNSSNNILGIEYLKALKKYKSKIMPIPVKREKVYYNDNKIVDEFASATAIRKFMEHKQFDDIIKVVPRNCYETLTTESEVGNIITDLSKYEKEIIYTLRRMSLEEIANLPDVNEGLENSLKNAANFCNNIKDFINIVKTKRYTQTRIQRILIFALLGITNKDMALAKKNIPYARVLGFNEKGKKLISDITNSSKVQLITSVKKFKDNNNNKFLNRLMDIDIFATDVYTLGYEEDSLAKLDYTHSMEFIKDNARK